MKMTSTKSQKFDQ